MIRRIERGLQQARAAGAGAGFPSQLELHLILRELSEVYWSKQLSPGDRTFLRRSYLSALETIKLIADDTFIEALAVITAKAPRDREAAEDKVHGEYVPLLREWIQASPMLDRKLADDIHSDPPKPPVPDVPSLVGDLRSLGGVSDFGKETDATRRGRPPSPAIGVLTNHIYASLKRAVSSARKKAGRTSKPFALRLTPEWRHQVGLLYMLLQLRLADMAWMASPVSSYLAAWYRDAQRTVEWMNDHVFDLLRRLDRDSLVDRTGESVALYVEGNRLLDALRTTYSVRGRRAATLWTFIHPDAKNRARVLRRSVTDPAGVTEIITALPGRPNPDDQDNAGAQSVDDLLASSGTTGGSNVQVYGLKKTGNTRRFDLHSIASRAKVRVSFEGRASPGAYARYVVVRGELKMRGSMPFIEASEVDEFRVPYVSLTGISQLFTRGGAPPVPPEPKWRTPTTATSQFAADERTEERLGEALEGQSRLVTDLLNFKQVRTELATILKSNRRLDLHDRAVRVRVWEVVLRKFLRESPTVAMSLWIGLIQLYLTHYTRHTFWNVRDQGTNYLDTTWPKDIVGQALQDCGVYAIETAYDIYRAVKAVANAPSVEFEMLITADHATLIGFFDKKWFFINNRRIDRPETLTGGRSAATFQAVGVGYRRVHNLKFNVLPFIKSAKPITTGMSDAAFKSAIWSDYQDLGGWGIAPHVGDQYYRTMRAFDTASRQLAVPLEGLRSGAPPSSPELVAATTAATTLFDMAEILVNKDLIFGRAVGTQGIVFTEQPRLPMYTVTDRLAKAAKVGTPLSPEQTRLVSRSVNHPGHMRDLWLKGARALATP